MGDGPHMELLLALGVLVYTHPDLVAQAASEAGPYLTGLNIGLAAIGLWAFATGRLVAKSTMDKCEEKLTAAEEELRQRNAEARDTLVPALVRATDLLARHIERQESGHTPPPPTRPARGRP